FGRVNRELNTRRVAAEPIPLAVRRQFQVSRLLGEVVPDVPLVAAARILAHRNANYHLMNSNRSLTADHLNVIYRMAAGRMPEAGDFFLESDLGPWSVDRVGVKLERRDIQASLDALRRNPRALDYINLAVPRGFLRPGAVASRARCTLTADAARKKILATFEADATGAFRVAVREEPSASVYLHALEPGGDTPAVVVPAPGPPPVATPNDVHPAPGAPPGLSIRFASEDQRIVLKAAPDGACVLEGEGSREPVFAGPVHHASISLGAASEDFLLARVEGNAGLSMTSSGEGGPLRLPPEIMAWESMQAASGHFGITANDLRLVRDV